MMEQLLSKILDACHNSWPGRTGEERAARVKALLDRVLPEYASVLGMSQEDVLTAIEGKRDYSAVNYYQEANFPKLEKVVIFETLDGFKAAYPSGKYICPACEGHSSNPYECDTGTVRKGKTCDWKSYSLFGTMGKGLRVVVKDKFLESPRVHEIFMPVEHVDGAKVAA